jgi:hypothetical protein
MRNDWTPAVLITASIALVTAGVVWLVSPWAAGRFGEHPGETIPRRRPPPQVVVWTGDLAPGLKGVLGPVWGDPKPDRAHDTVLNEDLGLGGDRALHYFRLLVFNITDETRSLALGEGGLVMADAGGGQPIPLRSLPAMLQRKEIELPGGLAFSLRTLGALNEKVEIPPGEFAKLVVPFGVRAHLETATAVAATAYAKPLRRRQMAATEYRRLISNPDERGVEDL